MSREKKEFLFKFVYFKKTQLKITEAENKSLPNNCFMYKTGIAFKKTWSIKVLFSLFQNL